MSSISKAQIDKTYYYGDSIVGTDTLSTVRMCYGRTIVGYENFYATTKPDQLYRKVYNSNDTLLAEGFVVVDSVFKRNWRLKKIFVRKRQTPTGVYRYYWPNGSLKRKGNYTIDESRTSTWVKYNPDGTVDPNTFDFSNEFDGLLSDEWTRKFIWCPILLKGSSSGLFYF